MSKRYAVEIDNKIVKWKDGDFECDDTNMLNKIKGACENAKKSEFIQIELDGSRAYSGKGVNPEPSWVVSFAFLQELSGGRMKFVAGDRPTWEKLGFKDEEDTNY